MAYVQSGFCPKLSTTIQLTCDKITDNFNQTKPNF